MKNTEEFISIAENLVTLGVIFVVGVFIAVLLVMIKTTFFK